MKIYQIKHTIMKEKTKQPQPGIEAKMEKKPVVIRKNYRGSEKLKGKVAIITGGDSGIGRAVAIHYACEGANVVLPYLSEDQDAKKTREMVMEYDVECLLLRGDVGSPDFCSQIIEKTISTFGQLDILVNNAGEQHVKTDIRDISNKQLEKTFRTNIFSMFYLVKEALNHMKEGSVIINTASITAYKGKEVLMDYSATKGAIVSFTRSLAKNLADKGIRVNAVAPGPIWTPLIPSTFPDTSDFGKNTALGRPGQPSEVAPAYVYLASEDSTFTLGQVIHVNGGEIVGG
jgi:NAD(P)-dependent dehydrogenase (short-subunit alcohol dehydrogenase family)